MTTDPLPADVSIGKLFLEAVWRGGVTIAEFEASMGDVSNQPCPACLVWWQTWRKRLTKMAGKSPDWRFSIDDARAYPMLDDDQLTDGELVVIASYLARSRPEVTRSVRHWMADIASSVLPVFERERAGDLRVRAAISTARSFVAGKAGDDERMAARAAALEASRCVGGTPAHFAALAAKHSLLSVRFGYGHQMQLCSLNAAKALVANGSGEAEPGDVEREQHRHVEALATAMAGIEQ
jgi:hypothetical protein